MKLHTGTRVLHYYDEEWKVNVLIEDELARYYRSLIPKYYRVKPQRYQTHITVVRREEIPNKELWGKYKGTEVEFQYSNVRNGTVYWWLDAYSEALLQLRVELGLPPYSNLTKPPDKKSCFHITIGNVK